LEQLANNCFPTDAAAVADAVKARLHGS
jgi:hypothetical protein